MTRKADTLRPFLRCAAVVLCSLALPLAVFALWDRALLAAPHIRTDGERFSAAGRANATACTLYAAEHVTKVPLGSNSVWDGGWTAGTMDGSALARARRTLRGNRKRQPRRQKPFRRRSWKLTRHPRNSLPSAGSRSSHAVPAMPVPLPVCPCW